MQKNCEKCGIKFKITKSELDFYKKISPKFKEKTYEIPSPNTCPVCRLKQRTCQRNEQYLYKNKSATDDSILVSIYPPNSPLKIISQTEWFSDQFDALEYGCDFDFQKPFFEQFNVLLQVVPYANMVVVNNENSDYTTGTAFCKNYYLINSSEYCEDCYYGKLLQSCKNTVDSAYIYDSELLYQCFNLRNAYNCHYVYNSQNVTDCFYSDNLNNSKNCFLCTNLNSKEYYFLNEKLSKAEYHKKVEDFLKQHKLEEILKIFNKLRKERVYKYANIVASENSSGDFIRNCKNCQNCFDVNDSEDCCYVNVGVKTKDLLDCSNMYINPELSYQVLGTIATFNVHFCIYVFHSSDLLYCQHCHSSQNCFGCVGLKNKKYCIFNKQYTKEEYEELVPKIIEQMQKTGEWGEFFPVTTAPFGYNESLANEYFPLAKDEAIKQGFKWNDCLTPPPQAAKTISKENMLKIPENIQNVPDEVLDWRLTCVATGKLYKITKPELEFYRKNNIAIPKRHPDQRHKERMEIRNPVQIWQRQCQHCGLEVQSTFALDAIEKIYCENCYLKEIY